MSNEEILSFYNQHMLTVNNEALLAENYGGYLRGHNGCLVENIAIMFLTSICEELELKDVTIDSKKERLYDKDGNYYDFSIDIQLKYKDKIFIVIEAKTYCEISMFKRVLFDREIAKRHQGVEKAFLLQLEDAMGNEGVGSKIKYSPTVKFLLNEGYDINILTLLEGQRRSSRPISKPEFFKELKPEVLDDIRNVLKKAIQEEYNRISSI